jgi:hypothetical protein
MYRNRSYMSLIGETRFSWGIGSMIFGPETVTWSENACQSISEYLTAPLTMVSTAFPLRCQP